ncbi:MAG TPA: spherulation-specific family 4 protein [Verrucomicrobiae bacterium]|jgi:hypothetical protein
MLIKQWFIGLLLVKGLVTMTALGAPLGLMVPAYFSPTTGGYWSELNTAAKQVPLIVIMNPDSGPGAVKNETYVHALAKLHQAGGKTIGYIHTSYGERPLAEVEKEINLYLSFYAMDGFFIDEMTGDDNAAHLNYYASIYQYIKARNPVYLVTGNPGTNTREDYLKKPTDDNLMIFEDNSTNYPAFSPAKWVAKYPATQFVHLPYNVATPAAMTNCLALAASRNASWVYITDDTLPNPYNTLPSYWTNEVALVKSLNSPERTAGVKALQTEAKR